MLDLRSESGPAGGRRVLGATWVSAGVHAAALVIALAITQRSGGPDNTLHEPPITPFVWMDRAGDTGGTPTDGGRTFGNQTDQPATSAERPGPDRRTLPAAPSRSFEASASPIDGREQQIVVPVVPEASGLRDVPGTVSDIPVTGLPPAGPGSNRGVGDGDLGTGLRHGPGNFGGPGPGASGRLTPPDLLHQVRPNYTTAAMQARISGVVVMDVVVLPDGSVGDVRIVRSLDRALGLDAEAIKAVRQWRFRPGTRAGKPVPMIVAVEMAFALR